MESELISKKELLERYGISYGALYRWKRMGLIPEDWFIKKSTPTGQETFFDRERICERLETILNSRDEASLQELAFRLGEKETENWSLVVGTSLGETRFEIERIRFIKVTKGSRETDITDYLRRIAK